MSELSTTTDANAARLKRHREIATRAFATVLGTRQWRQYKQQSFEEFIALADRAERVELLEADLSGDFDIVYKIDQPAPCTPRNGELVVAESVIYHLHYEESFTFEPPPPWVPLRVLSPRDPWHPNCAVLPGLFGSICLGDLLGTLVSAPPAEIVLAGHFAMALRDVSLDVEDPQGVLNVPAVHYYLEHPEYLPLTYAGLFDPWDGWKGVVAQ